MTLLAPPTDVATNPTDTSPTIAEIRAQTNVKANLAAIGMAQPRLATPFAVGPTGWQWAFGRDGALTASRDGQWWGGNSLPARSAEQMLKDVDTAVAVTCFVAPVHAAQVRVLLDKIESGHAVIVIQPDSIAASIALRCEDFSTDIAAGRLWWTVCDQWAEQLRQLLTDKPGLPVPGRFVRLPDADETVVADLIAKAQQILGDEISRRAQQITTLRQSPRRKRSAVAQVVVVAPSRFRLWSSAGRILAETLTRTTPQHVCVNWKAIDTDNPTTSSPLAIAEIVNKCDAIVMADVARSDKPDLVAADVPWITWVTTPRLPAYSASGPNDRLLLADVTWLNAATANGWPASRLTIAGWPRQLRRAPMSAFNRQLVLLADVSNLATPKSLDDYSSHKLLWEEIREELTRYPLAVTENVHGYLDAKLKQRGFAPESIDRTLFVEKLVLPAYAVGVASLLIERQIPLSVYGLGWDGTLCRDHGRGAVKSKRELESIVDSAAGLVRPWPVNFAHEIDALGAPVVSPARSVEELIGAAHVALEGRMTDDGEMPQLSADMILRWV